MNYAVRPPYESYSDSLLSPEDTDYFLKRLFEGAIDSIGQNDLVLKGYFAALIFQIKPPRAKGEFAWDNSAGIT